MSNTFKILLPYVRIEDPHLCTDAHAILSIRRLLFPGLLTHDGQKAVGVLCRSWETEDQGRKWIFHLKKGIYFSNGKEMQAEDVIYSLKRASSSDVDGQLFTVTYNEYFGDAEISAIDNYTVRLVNPDPISDLADLLPDLSIMPKGWKSYDDGTGAGPYELMESSPGRVLLKKRLENADLPEILEVLAEPDSGRRVEKISSGKAELAFDPPLSMMSMLEKSSDVDIFKWDTALSVIFFIECSAPPLDDIRVRRALNMAFNKNSLINEVAYGYGKPLNGPFSDHHFAHDDTLPPFPFDPAEARWLLSDAGVDETFELTIHAPVIIPDEGPAMATFLAEAYRELGIKVKVELHKDRTEYARKVAQKELHGIFCFDSSPLSSFKVLHEKLDSDYAGTWWQGYHNQEVNNLISEAVNTIADKDRQSIYRKVYGIIREEAPWIYLYQAQRFWIIRPDISPKLVFDNLGFFNI